MAITVNGAEISEIAIDAEVQYHPAESLDEARREAALALTLRALLLGEADRQAIRADTEEATIEALLARSVAVPTPDDETCRRYYDNNRRRFRSPDLYQAQHILIAADPEDEAARTAARTKAEQLIALIGADSNRMSELAREHSDCPSKDNGGHLGQVTRGSTIPEFETFLFSLDEGEICSQPIESRYGYHVARLLRREPGRDLPYETVRDRIDEYLRAAAWQTAVRHYLEVLIAGADVSGIDVPAPGSPLLQ